MAQASTRIEVSPDIEGGWAVTRDCIIDGYFVDVGAANDYASACAQRARRAGIAVSLQVAAMQSSSTEEASPSPAPAFNARVASAARPAGRDACP